MNYIWRKRVDRDWLGSRGKNLLIRFADVLAVIERPGYGRSLLEISCRTEAQASKLLWEFGGSVVKLKRGWLRRLESQTRSKPLVVGSRLVVVRTRQNAARLKRNHARALIIPAEAAFGTGEHATTAMCLRMLEEVTRSLSSGWTALDAGTGSGILAIAASCLGAGHVLAIESDPLACTTARRNAGANKAQNIEISNGDVLKLKRTTKFHIILANLFSEVVIQALPIWSRHLRSGGHLIISGILRTQETAVVDALRRQKLEPQKVRRRGKWIALHSQQPKQKES